MNWRQFVKPVPETLRFKRVLSPKVKSDDAESKPQIVNKELILLQPVANLVDTIVNLTKTDLAEQKRLLRLHCQQYSSTTHFWALKEKWAEKAAILEYCAHLPRSEAEYEAAMMYRLEAFMDELTN